jgi:hypothetical protein
MIMQKIPAFINVSLNISQVAARVLPSEHTEVYFSNSDNVSGVKPYRHARCL